jgi:hypothetical protein
MSLTSDYRKQAKDATRHLKLLIATAKWACAALDAEMAKPSTPDRGSRIAKICNVLEMEADMAKRFGLTRRKRGGK